MKKRNIGDEILQGIREIKSGKGRRFKVDIPENISAIRQKMELSQSEFAELLCVSLRTLQDWERGRRKPSGPAYALLRVAVRHPKALVS